MNSPTLFVPALVQFRAWLLCRRGWCVRPVLIVAVATAALVYALPALPDWRFLQAQGDLALLRSKLIGESQLTRVLFSMIHEPAETAAREKGEAAPAIALASVAAANALSPQALKAQLDAERATIRGFLAAIEERRAHAAEPAAGWAALACQALTRLGDLESIAGRDPAAREHYQAALALATEAGIPLAWCDTAQNLQLALQLKGRSAEAERLARQLVELRTAHQGPTHFDTTLCLTRLAMACEAKGDKAGAEPLYIMAVALQARSLGAAHPDTLPCLSRLAVILKGKGDYAGAIPLYRRILKIREETLGREHPETLKSINDLAVFLWIENDHASSETLYRRGLASSGLAALEEAQGAQFLEVAITGRNDGYAEAEALLRRGLAGCERRLGGNDMGTLMNLKNLGGLLMQQEKLGEAAALLERALAGLEKKMPRTSHTLLTLMETVSQLREKQGRWPEALLLAEELLARTRETQPAGSEECAALEKRLEELREKATATRPKFGATRRAPVFRTDC